MACRIGITTDPDRRKQEWEAEHPLMTDWQIMGGPYVFKSDAQAEEDRLAALHGCEASGGGDDPDTPFSQWYVYGFNY